MTRLASLLLLTLLLAPVAHARQPAYYWLADIASIDVGSMASSRETWVVAELTPTRPAQAPGIAALETYTGAIRTIASFPRVGTVPKRYDISALGPVAIWGQPQLQSSNDPFATGGFAVFTLGKPASVLTLRPDEEYAFGRRQLHALLHGLRFAYSRAWLFDPQSCLRNLGPLKRLARSPNPFVADAAFHTLTSALMYHEQEAMFAADAPLVTQEVEFTSSGKQIALPSPTPPTDPNIAEIAHINEALVSAIALSRRFNQAALTLTLIAETRNDGIGDCQQRLDGLINRDLESIVRDARLQGQVEGIAEALTVASKDLDIGGLEDWRVLSNNDRCTVALGSHKKAGFGLLEQPRMQNCHEPRAPIRTIRNPAHANQKYCSLLGSQSALSWEYIL